jgi:WD40 repeat protein/serine/threonine protein kinase
MTERMIFLNALEKESVAARAAYLDEACAGRPALRRRVEELLRSHEAIDTFLEVPAMEQMEAINQSLAFLGPPGEANSLGRLDYYEVLEAIGRGGTGMVLRAKDTKLQRVVAIKVLAPGLAASSKARQRFVHEAQAAAAVRDDHVVAIHAVSDDGPVPYLVMDYIHGVTLEERVKQAEAGLDLKEILRIGLQVAKGLAAAHAQGLIHRDIKPANILLDNSVQRVKITDFGLAGAAADASLAGVIAGTPRYMSPEQALGQVTDQRTDLYSLGSVLYTLCTGQPPFQDESTSAVLERVRGEAPRPVRELNPAIPEWLSALIGKLHARAVTDRLASAQEIADELSRRLAQLQGPPAEVPVVSVTRREVSPNSWARRRRFLIALCLAGSLIAIGVLVVYLVLLRHQPPDDPLPGGPIPIIHLDLRRDSIPPALLMLAGGGDPAQAPPELAGVLGDGRFLPPQSGGILWMQQSPDENTLAVPVAGDLVLFEVQTGKYLRSLKGPGGRIVWVSFSRDSQLLAASTWYEGQNGALRVWDLRTDKELFTKPVPGRKISGVCAFSTDARRLVGEGSEGLQVWDALSGEEVQTIRIVPEGCSRICFSPDGRRVAAAFWNGRNVKVFDWDDKKLVERSTLEGHSAPVMAVAYSSDGKCLASGTEKEFKLWEAESLREIRTVQTPAQELAFTPDCQKLYASATCAKFTPVHTWTRWDLSTQIELPALSLEVSVEPNFAMHCLSRDGKVLFLAHGAHYPSSVRAIDTASGKDIFPRRGHIAPLNAVATSPNGGTLASAGEDRAVKVWNLADGRVLHSFAVHSDAVWGLVFSPNGKLLASGSRDGTIVLWDLRSGTQIRALRGHSRSPSRIQFSPDGKFLAAGGESGNIKRWDVAGANEANPLPGHSGVVRCVAFSPDGKLLASGGEDRSVCLHDVVTGGLRKLPVPAAVHDVGFSPDGRTMAAVCDGPDAAVCLWDLESMQETTWQGHGGHIHGLAFSPTMPVLATSGEDGTVKLWNLTLKEPQPRTIGPGPFGGPVRSVAFTPDGRYLATANANGMVYLLRMEEPAPSSKPET